MRFFPKCFWWALSVLLGGSLVACGLLKPQPVQPLPPPATATSLVLVPPPPAPASPSPLPDSGWQEAEPGLALRRLHFFQEQKLVLMSIVRIDPHLFRFQVGYRPEKPLSLEAWANQAAAVAGINGGFFDQANQATALVISGGGASGTSYQGQGGMFAVDVQGKVALRSLADQPYAPDENLQEALQGWPILIKPGSILAYTNNEDKELDRRSAVALDQAGQVLLIASWGSPFTLAGFAQWLSQSDLEIDAALNLDGGSSTGLYLQSGPQRDYIPAFVPLPLVLLVLPQ